MKVAMDRIEPKVDRIVDHVSVMDALSDLSRGGSSNLAGISREVLGDSARGSKTSTMLDRDFPQLSASTGSDSRPSILYDVLNGQKADISDRVFNLPSLHRGDVDDGQGGKIVTGGDDNAESMNGDLDLKALAGGDIEHQYGAQSLHLRQLDPRLPASGEFHSLDEAFEDDFFSKPQKGSDHARRSSNKGMSGDTLIDMDFDKSISPESSNQHDVSPKPGDGVTTEALTSTENLAVTSAVKGNHGEAEEAGPEWELGVEPVSGEVEEISGQEY
jgi:hypothetical protein